MSVSITLNGEAKTLPEPVSVTALLESLEVKPTQVAVEVNRAIVPRSAHESTQLAEGDIVEIVKFIGGG